MISPTRIGPSGAALEQRGVLLFDDRNVMETPMAAFEEPATDKFLWETTDRFTPRFSADGLITAVAVDADRGQVVMIAHMNAQSLALTLDTGIAHYWSRSRQALWKKGESSGNTQEVVEIRTDCDQDAIVLRVRTQGDGANCHTGRHSCFYRVVRSADGGFKLDFDDRDQPRFDPASVYGKKS